MDESYQKRLAIAQRIAAPLRERRYMIEGGLRRIFRCSVCDFHVIAEEPGEGRETLRAEHPEVKCSHLKLETQRFYPPDDFS